MTTLTSHPISELKIGMKAQQKRLCTQNDLYVFANVSGDLNPMYLPKEDGDFDGKAEAMAPAMWLGALIASVLGNHLPGPGTRTRAQSLRFLGEVHAGEEVTITAEIVELTEDGGAVLDTWITNAAGARIVEGRAEVTPPAKAASFDIQDVPGLTVQSREQFDKLLERAAPLAPTPCAVVAPEDEASLGGALLAAEHTIIKPILIGDQAKIAQAAQDLDHSLEGIEIIHEPNHSAAAARAVALVHEGRARALMKGHLHTDELLRQVIKRDGGLRTGRRLSHVFVLDVPGLGHPLAVTDAAINIAPDLNIKKDIAQNAINLMHALGVETPRVGVLSAVETVNPAIPSTLDAAALSKMADRGQITGGLVDGPLAMDNAIDMGAARTKGIKSMVAGQADILLAPNLESGNMIAKELTFLAHAEIAGVALGAQVPIILTSRSDNETARLVSCAVASLYAEYNQ